MTQLVTDPRGIVHHLARLVPPSGPYAVLCRDPLAHPWTILGSEPTGPHCPVCDFHALPNLTFNSYHLPTVARLCRELGAPVDDALASFVWQLSNSPTLPVSIGELFMQASGYVPYKGFPLTRLKTPNMETKKEES